MRLRLSATVIAVLALSGQALAQEPVTANTVVATVNGTDITLGHMIIARERLPDQYRELPNEVLFKGILDQLVQQEALRSGREGFSTRSERTLENERRALQVSEVIQEAVDAAITDEAIEAAYLARYAEAEPDEEFNAAHILVETEAEAQNLVTQLAEGGDFGELARENSTGPSGPNGGDLGWFSKGMMVPEFEAAVIALEPGAISQPVQTQFGWHVIQLNEVRQKDTPTLDDVREELIQQLQRETVDQILATATDGAEISRVEEGEIDPAVLSDQSISFE
ncbi:MAG: peptidylprolyl isomerase [Pseudomonadota bacterium]